MTARHVRASVRAYFRLREIVRDPDIGERAIPLEEAMAWIERDCYDVTSTASPSRWAREQVGSVLAAGMGSVVTFMRGVNTPINALRIFGLTGTRPPTNQQAWTIMDGRPINDTMLAEVEQQAGVNLRLPANPTKAEILNELARPHSNLFGVELAYRLAERFRDHREEPYRKALAGLVAANDRGEMAASIPSSLGHDRLSLEDWQEIVDGRIPLAKLEIRAGFIVARKFVEEYWEAWRVK